MRRLACFSAAALLMICTLAIPGTGRAQPTFVSYQGQLDLSGQPFNGTAQFKFAIIQGPVAYWSNDGSSVAGEEPHTSVPVIVTQGLFNVLLGSTSMVPLTADAIGSLTAPSLRLWVDTGTGFEQLPDQPIASSTYSLHSESAERSLAGFTANGVIHSLQGGFQFPDGTIQATASLGGSGGGNTLDQAYNQGGPGAGRTITANSGAVSLAGSDGLRVNGSIGVGTIAASPFARICVQNVGGVDNAKLLAFDEAEGGEFFFESGFSGTGSTGNKLKLNTAWTTGATIWRGDGHIGIGTDPSEARLAILHSGTSSASPGLAVVNANTGDAFGLTVGTTGTGPAATFQSGSGDAVRYLDGSGSVVGRVDNSGRAFFSSLQNNSGTTQVDGSGRLRLVGAFGGGVGGAPIYSENTTSNGVAFWGKASGTDGAMILEQNGTGSLVRAFKSGVLKFEVQNSGRVVTTALQITGGGDLAEPFTVADDPSVAPGSVLVIDDQHPGELRLSERAYDTRVAGVVSGAGGISPGITLTPGEHQKGGWQVALTGRVYALADASSGSIHPGDLLTTSGTPGHIMKAGDPERSHGAILGKAMSGLESGRGLVLILVSLQ